MPRPASLKEDGRELESAVARQRASPETFCIPTRTARETLRTGDCAKLLFRFAEAGERMWVLVAGREKLRYSGVLLNQPVSFEAELPPVQKGSIIVFKSEHVCDIDQAPLKHIRKEFGGDFARLCADARRTRPARKQKE